MKSERQRNEGDDLNFYFIIAVVSSVACDTATECTMSIRLYTYGIHTVHTSDWKIK
jgi:hypothetical protein